jgi:hypothetical protein
MKREYDEKTNPKVLNSPTVSGWLPKAWESFADLGLSIERGFSRLHIGSLEPEE